MKIFVALSCFVAAITALPQQDWCKQPWIQLDTGCYLFLVKENSTWMEARDKCEQEGGYLVKVDSKEENDAIFGKIQSKFLSQNKKVSFWIGLFSDSFQYEWKWVSSGMPLGSYSNWAQGEPSPGEKCVLFHANIWTNRQCWTNDYAPWTYNALCEKESRTTTTTTPPTAREEETDKNCGDDEICLKREDCPSFLEEFDRYTSLAQGLVKSSLRRELREVVCNKGKKAVCCPNSESVFSIFS